MSGREVYGWIAGLLAMCMVVSLLAASYPPEDQPLLLVTSQEEAGIHIYSFKKHGHFCFMVDKHGYPATLECPR